MKREGVENAAERNHQSLGNQFIDTSVAVGESTGELQQRERLGGMLRFDYRQAA